MLLKTFRVKRDQYRFMNGCRQASSTPRGITHEISSPDTQCLLGHANYNFFTHLLYRPLQVTFRHSEISNIANVITMKLSHAHAKITEAVLIDSLLRTAP